METWIKCSFLFFLSHLRFSINFFLFSLCFILKSFLLFLLLQEDLSLTDLYPWHQSWSHLPSLPSFYFNFFTCFFAIVFFFLILEIIIIKKTCWHACSYEDNVLTLLLYKSLIPLSGPFHIIVTSTHFLSSSEVLPFSDTSFGEVVLGEFSSSGIFKYCRNVVS